MAEGYDTAMDLLLESADALEASAAAATSADDAGTAAHLGQLAARIRRYLETSRPTTTLGMPRITSTSTELSAAMVIRRQDGERFGHVRIVPEQ